MLLNQSYLENVSRERSVFLETNQSQILHENQRISFSTKTFDLFLSHSYLDRKLIYAIVYTFNNAGYSVYVDWMEDTQLDRSRINQTTAETLRQQMDGCSGLAYISTENISNSKWCPWELGYVDGKKNGRCAILPVVKTGSDSFVGQEYLSIYPYIDYEEPKGGGKKDFWVNDPNDHSYYVRLRQWLDGKDPYVHND